MRDTIHILFACALAAVCVYLLQAEAHHAAPARFVLARPLPNVELAFVLEPLGALMGAVLSSVGVLQLHLNAGSARVNLPRATLTGTVDANAGSVGLCLPSDVGIRITSNDNITSGNNFVQAGLTKNGSTWESANFASATDRITLTATANAGSVNLNPQGGCQ